MTSLSTTTVSAASRPGRAAAAGGSVKGNSSVMRAFQTLLVVVVLFVVPMSLLAWSFVQDLRASPLPCEKPRNQHGATPRSTRFPLYFGAYSGECWNSLFTRASVDATVRASATASLHDVAHLTASPNLLPANNRFRDGPYRFAALDNRAKAANGGGSGDVSALGQRRRSRFCRQAVRSVATASASETLSIIRASMARLLLYHSCSFAAKLDADVYTVRQPARIHTSLGRLSPGARADVVAANDSNESIAAGSPEPVSIDAGATAIDSRVAAATAHKADSAASPYRRLAALLPSFMAGAEGAAVGVRRPPAPPTAPKDARDPAAQAPGGPTRASDGEGRQAEAPGGSPAGSSTLGGGALEVLVAVLLGLLVCLPRGLFASPQASGRRGLADKASLVEASDHAHKRSPFPFKVAATQSSPASHALPDAHVSGQGDPADADPCIEDYVSQIAAEMGEACEAPSGGRPETASLAAKGESLALVTFPRAGTQRLTAGAGSGGVAAAAGVRASGGREGEGERLRFEDVALDGARDEYRDEEEYVLAEDPCATAEEVEGGPRGAASFVMLCREGEDVADGDHSGDVAAYVIIPRH